MSQEDPVRFHVDPKDSVLVASIRPAVLSFALEMEYILRGYDFKGGWEGCGTSWLCARIQDNIIDLQEAQMAGNKDDVRKAAIDVANYAMMIVDNNLKKENER